MKPLTLASLLATSAIAGAGAAAVGGPFFLAVTIPFVQTIEDGDFSYVSTHPVGQGGQVATFTASTPMVIREFRGEPGWSAFRSFLTLIDPSTGSRQLVAAIDNENGPLQDVRWEDGIVVPRNHQLEIFVVANGGAGSTPYDVFVYGYRY